MEIDDNVLNVLKSNQAETAAKADQQVKTVLVDHRSVLSICATQSVNVKVESQSLGTVSLAVCGSSSFR